MQRLTLQEIAAKYRKTPKTFSRYVRDLGIPHERIGRSMVFDEATVAMFLSTVEVKQNVVKFKPRVTKTKGGRFAEAVGL